MKIHDSLSLKFLFLIAGLAIAIPDDSFGDVTVYTDLTAFNNALASNGYSSQTLDFDSETAGTTYAAPSTIGHVTFSNFGPPDLIVTDDFATTSGANYLGMDSVGLANQFTGGFNIDMGFAASNAVGFNIVTGEIANVSIFDDDIQLVVPGSGTVLLDVDDLQGTVGGSDSVFFVGLIDTMSTFTTAQVRYDAAAVGTITYNIDDITTAAIPEPASSVLLIGSALMVLHQRRRR